MNSIGVDLMWCVIQVTLLAAVAALIYGLVRKSGPPARALTALAGLMLIVALTTLTFSPWPQWRLSAELRAGDGRTADGTATHGEAASDGMSEVADSQAQGTRAKPHQPTEALSPAAEFFKTLLTEMQRTPATPERETWGWAAYV